MNRKLIILTILFTILTVNTYCGHLIEDVRQGDTDVCVRVRNRNTFVSLFSKDLKTLDTLVSDSAEITLKTGGKPIKGCRLVALEVPEKPEWKKIGGSGMKQGRFRNPSGLYIDYFGKLFVCDSGNDRVQVLSSDGGFVFEFGNFGWSTSISELKGQFNQPTDIAVNRFIYVTDTENNRVAKFDIDGNFISSWGGNGNRDGEFYFPKGIDVDLTGDVYVADTENNRVQKFDGSGNFILSFGSFGRGFKQFNRPSYIAVDTEYNMYISDTRNNRIQVFDRFTAFRNYLKFGQKYVRRPAGISVLGNIVAVVSESEKKLYIGDSKGEYYKSLPLEWTGSDVSFAAYDKKIRLYVLSRSDNTIYYMEMPKYEKIF
ncbi:MAG: NHL repeat-containing protein [Candidatus Muiribacteriaceae bacterium]